VVSERTKEVIKVKYYIYTLCFLFGVSGAWVVAHSGHQFGLSDIPNERSSHSKPTPKGGGIGLLAGFIFCSLYTGVSHLFWIPAVCISILGLFADRFEISPQTRLFVQFVAAIIIVTGTEPMSVGLVKEIILIIFFTIYVVGTSNYYNFMDGINGIAGITGMIGFGLLSHFAVVESANPQIVILCVCMSLACLGFLPFNVPKARVFMGDVGSILLGFVFGGMVVYISKSFTDFICAASFLFPFYADELTTLVVRIKDGDRLTKPHRRHLYQLLANEYGIQHWQVSLGYGLAQLIIGLSILLIKNIGILAVITALLFYFFCFTGVSCAVRKKLLERL